MITYTQSSTNLHSNQNMWNRAITDAEREIDGAQRRIRRLRECIRILRKKMRNGEPWPKEEGCNASTQI
jgi:hypothetical protein